MVRYSTIFKSVVILDLIVETILWLIGAYTHYQTNELDQIIKFHFTESVFDILVMSSLKTMIIFILVTELDTVSTKIAFNSFENNRKSEEAEASASSQIQSDHENLINTGSSVSISHNKTIKAILHMAISIFSFTCAVYTVIKFSLIMKEISRFNKNEIPSLPMDYYYLAVLCVEFGFVLIQLVISCFSWKGMRSLVLQVQKDASSTDTDKKPIPTVNMKRLLSLSFPERYIIATAFVMLMIASLTSIVIPFFFGSVIDAATNYSDLTEMNHYIIYMFLVYLVGSVAGGIRSWLFELAGQRVVARLRSNVFKAIIKQDIEFFDTNRTGELTSRISSDTQVLQNAVTVNLSMLARYLFQIFGSILFMFTLQPSLTGILLAIVPIVSLSTVQYGRYLKVLRKNFQDELALSSVIAEESISSARTVRSFAAEEKMSKAYKDNIDKSYKIGKKLAVATGGFMGFVGTLTAGSLSLVLWYGGKLVHDEKITTGLLASFLMYTLQVAMAFAFLSSLFGDFMQALGASQRIFEILDKVPKIPSGIGFNSTDDTENEKNFDGSISFKDISFTYPTRLESKVLTDISFDVPKGKCIAFVGPSGGGKSTIFCLIERFYNPDSGEINIGQNKIPINSVDTDWLHSKIALVAQEPVLFGGSLKENISYGLPEDQISMERIIEVSKQANAYEFINALETGFDTLVGERGIRLSGGQKQRIAIARALLMNPKLLLLDEATSALDSESEHLVQEAIDRAMKERTVCVIAHRLSTVRNADKVIVIDKGTICEQGSHDELCQIDGVYKKLVLRQLMSKDFPKNDEI